jgi:metal-responsive CopG/Arc/MetJ family transcriptional regulator
MASVDMRNSRILSVSMPEAQMKAAEELAKAENRTMSELVREALRTYEKQRRAETTAKYRRKAEDRGITEADVVRIVKEVRRQEQDRKNKPPRS